MRKTILLSALNDGGGGSGQPPGAGASGGSADWRSQLPEELRAEASLASIKDIPSLAKGYVHAQRLVGADKIVRPNDKWTQAEWDNFYKELGRPESPDKYPDHGVKLPEGLELDPQSLADAKKALHEAGLTPAQAKKALDYHVNLLVREHVAEAADRQAKTQATNAKLKELWGQETDTNLALAKAAVLQHGGQELLKELGENGLGNSVPLIQFLYKMATLTKEDVSNGGAGNFLTGRDRALTRINEIKSDPNLFDALRNRSHPNHAAISAEWLNLHGQMD